ncbi:hypothetical protein AgCh_009569 [Apium graveolens]
MFRPGFLIEIDQDPDRTKCIFDSENIPETSPWWAFLKLGLALWALNASYSELFAYKREEGDFRRPQPPQFHHLQAFSGFQAFIRRISMADRDLTRLGKMNTSKRGTSIQIQSPYTSLIDMINSRGEEYPSLSEFDSYNHVENNSKWRDGFVRLTWAGGDWATLFHRPFCKVSDGSPGSTRLTDEEEVAYQTLISDNGKIDTWTLLEEFSLKKVGLSQASDKACKAINNINTPKEGESGCQKKAKLNKDPRNKADAPSFLRPHVPVVELGDDVDPPFKEHSFRPNWGFGRSDTVVGFTKHSKDWSYHSITPHDFTDIVMGSDIESIELLGSQAQAASNTYFQAALHQARSWKGNSDEFKREIKKWKERTEVLLKKLETKGEEHLRLIPSCCEGYLEKHPGLVDPKDFISLEQPETEDSLDALFNFSQPDDHILDRNTASPPASPTKDVEKEGAEKEHGNDGSQMEE